MAPSNRFRLFAAHVVRAIVSPYYRYRYAQLLHAVRVGLAMLASILVTSGIDLPHGLWASVTVLVVIGGLQHHGNIRKRAAERALGTTLGLLAGLSLLAQLRLFGSLPLTYVLMSVLTGICGYYAIGRPGYVALLTAITMCIVAGHGDNSIDTGLWRALNVMIGIVIALAFSFALPLHATYTWRYLLARNLRECARVHTRIATGAPLDPDIQIATFMAVGARLVQLRSLMPSVAKEIDVPMRCLEAIQRLHRSLLSGLEMMSAAALEQAESAGRAGAVHIPADEASRVRATLLATARALRFGSGARLRLPEPAAATATTGTPSDAPAQPRESHGADWLAHYFAEQVERLRALLAETEPNWNIERHASPAERDDGRKPMR